MCLKLKTYASRHCVASELVISQETIEKSFLQEVDIEKWRIVLTFVVSKSVDS